MISKTIFLLIFFYELSTTFFCIMFIPHILSYRKHKFILIHINGFMIVFCIVINFNNKIIIIIILSSWLSSLKSSSLSSLTDASFNWIVFLLKSLRFLSLLLRATDFTQIFSLTFRGCLKKFTNYPSKYIFFFGSL